MISGGNATVYVSSLDEAIEFYAERLGLTLTNRIGQQWATVQTGPSYWKERRQGVPADSGGEGGAGLTIGLHPHSARHPAPRTPGGIGFGLETYTPIEDVAARLRDRSVRVDPEIVRYEGGNLVALADQDGLPTYVNEFPPDMLEDVEQEGDRSDAIRRADIIAGGHAIVYVKDMDRAVRFYTETLGLKLTYRFEDKIAFVEAGRLVIAIHPQTPRTPEPGTRGSVVLGLTIDEPIDRVVTRLTTKGVRFTGPIVRAEADAFVELEDPSGNLLYFWQDAARPHAREEPAQTAAARS